MEDRDKHWNRFRHTHFSNNLHDTRTDTENVIKLGFIWFVVNIIIGILSFVIGILKILFIIFLCSLPFVLLIYIGYVLYAKFESKKVVAIGVIITLFCYFGIIHYVVPRIMATPPPNETVTSIHNTLGNLWGNVGPNRNNSSSDFVNGQSNSFYQQQGNLINTQSQSSLKDEGQYKSLGTDDMHLQHSGNRAVVHYDVYYSFNNSNQNSNTNSEIVAKRYAWVAHLQKIHGKWLVKTNTSNNQVVSSS